MALPSDRSAFPGRLFPEADAALQRLFARAADEAGLLHADFYLIRDLLELSDYAEVHEVHVLLLILVLVLQEGSLCVEASEPALARRLIDLTDAELARDWAARIVKRLQLGLPALIGTSADDDRPVVLHRSNGRSYLYFQRFLRNEQLLCSRLAAHLEVPAPELSAEKLRSALRHVLEERPPLVNGVPLRLSSDQRLAVALALLRNFTIISGGPGTGKTSLVIALLRCLVHVGFAPDRLAVAAPTGRAAQRLTDALQQGLASLLDSSTGSPEAGLAAIAGQTLHQLLGYHPDSGHFRHHSEHRLPFEVVIVDEVSMVGVGLMTQLLQALRPGSKLVLLGDRDQLPSVDAGAVLASLAPAGARARYRPETCARLAKLCDDLQLTPVAGKTRFDDALVVLEENFRSQPAIQNAARAVNANDAAALEALPRIELRRSQTQPGISRLEAGLPRTGCWLLQLDRPDALQQVLRRWADENYLSAADGRESYRDLVARIEIPDNADPSPDQRETLDLLFGRLNEARVLTVLREGPWGCVEINRLVEQTLRLRFDRGGRGNLFAGAPVLVTRNLYDRQLFNGDVGVTVRCPSGGYRLVFPRQGSYVSFAAESIPAHEPAFALTVHKSQGSEYGNVLLALPPQGGRRLMTREIIYTAITRARNLAILCGPLAVLQSAIGRRVERESALLSMLAAAEG